MQADMEHSCQHISKEKLISCNARYICKDWNKDVAHYVFLIKGK